MTALESTALRIGVVGEFNAGKSSLLNWLLGSELMAIDIFQTTATINVARHGETERLIVYKTDGTEQVRPIGDVVNYVADRGEFPEVRHLVIESPGVPTGIELVDTPGFNDPNPRRDAMVLELLPRLDGILFLCDATQPLKQSELPFLKKSFGRYSLEHTYFILNQADLLKTRDAVTSVRRHVIAKLDRFVGDLGEVERELGMPPRSDRWDPTRVFTTCTLPSAWANMDDALRGDLQAEMARLRDVLAAMGRDARAIRERQRLAAERAEIAASIRSAQEVIHRASARTGECAGGSSRLAPRARVQRDAVAAFERSATAARQRIPAAVAEVIDRALASLGNRLNDPMLLANSFAAEAEIKQRLQVAVDNIALTYRSLLQSEMKGAIDHFELTASVDGVDIGSLSEYSRAQDPHGHQMMQTSALAGLVSTLGLVLIGPLGLILGAALPLMQVSAARDTSAAARQVVVQKLVRDAQAVLGSAREAVLHELSNALARLEKDVERASIRFQWDLLAEAAGDADRAEDEQLAQDQLRQLHARLRALATPAT